MAADEQHDDADQCAHRGRDYELLNCRSESFAPGVVVGGVGVHGPEQDPAGSNKDRARGRESGQDAQRYVSQDADTHADHCSANHRPCEAGDR